MSAHFKLDSLDEEAEDDDHGTGAQLPLSVLVKFEFKRENGETRRHQGGRRR